MIDQSSQNVEFLHELFFYEKPVEIFCETQIVSDGKLYSIGGREGSILQKSKKCMVLDMNEK